MSLEKFKQVIGEDFSQEADFIDERIKELSLDKDSKILDVGTGFGAMSILLALNGFHVLTGQPEHDPEWEKQQAHYCKHEHEHKFHHHNSFPSFNWKDNAKAVGVEDKITFQHLNAEHLNFPEQSFDAIFMYDTLQHIKNRETALNECIRVMKINGLICVIEWNEKSIKIDEEKYKLKIDYIDPRQILNRKDISIELIKGNFVNSTLLG